MDLLTFPGPFRAFDAQTTAARIHGVIGGSGPPLLLLHGIPETHLMWRDVAPALAERFTVVATDLRGFDDSGAPRPIATASTTRCAGWPKTRPR